MAHPQTAELTRPSAARATGRRRDAVELAVGYGLILVVIWTPRGWQSWFYWAAIAWILGSTYRSFDGWQRLGFRIDGFGGSLWVVAFTGAGTALALMLASRLQTLHAPPGILPLFKRFWAYCIWALLQQFVLQDFVLIRLLRLLPNKTSAVIAATSLFAIAHLPSPILTLATLLWGFAACTRFLRYRNIYTLAISHAILGVCVTVCVPGAMHHNMRVGLGYLTYRASPVVPLPQP